MHVGFEPRSDGSHDKNSKRAVEDTLSLKHNSAYALFSRGAHCT